MDKINYLLILCIVIFISCNYNKSHSNWTFETLINISNIKIVFIEDKKDKLFLLDSLNNIIDSIECKYSENNHCNPTIIITDINNDTQYDILIPVNYSDANTLISYYALFSDSKGLLLNPKIKKDNVYLDFFSTKDFVNYNMRMVNKNLFLFQHKYNNLVFYKLENQTNFVPIAKIFRNSSNFNQISYWNDFEHTWNEPTSIKNKVDSIWYYFAKDNWDKPFIGESF